MPGRAPTISAKIRGMKGFKRRTSRLKGLSKSVNRVLSEIADEILWGARFNVPVDTGLLYSTIQKRKTPAGWIVSAGDPNPKPPPTSQIPRRKTIVSLPSNTPAPYALAQHESPNQPRRKYLERAYAESVNPVRVQRHLKPVVIDAAKG